MAAQGVLTKNALRERAESLLTLSREDVASVPTRDIQELVYELQVYQIELQMQNDELLAAQVELSDARDKYQDLFDFAPVGYATLDNDGAILKANLMLCTMLGLNRNEVIGKGFSRYIAPCCQDKFYLHRKQVLITGHKEICEVEIRHTDGHLVYVQLQSMLVENLGGIYSMAVSDITEKAHAMQRLGESEERYQLAMNAMTDGIWDWNLKNGEMYLSPGYLSMLGLSEGELKSNLDAIAELLHPTDSEVKRQYLDQHLAGSERLLTMHLRMRHKDGTYRWILCRSITLRNAQGKATRIVGVHTDITEMRQIEAKLARERDKAEAANQAKSQFLANMSHEIRTPLNAIIGLATLLNRSHTLSEKQSTQLKVLNQSAASLLVLVNELLDLSKIETNAMVLEHIAFDLPALLEEVVQMIKVKASEKHLRLLLNYAPADHRYYKGDPHRLRQIITNLVGNAVKFTEYGQVRVDLKTNMPYGQIVIMVSDTGIGIAPEKHDTVFEHFMQADASMTRKYGSAGLGLSICKELVEHMGGSISLNSEPGKGSVFTICLPLETVEAPEAVEQQHTDDQEYSFKDHLLLLVEDHEPNILIATTFLEIFNYPYDIARSGEEALIKISETRYSLILMDIQMQDMDGFEATRRIRKMEQNLGRKTPIIAMTAHAMAGDKEKCLQRGMDDYIAKPFDPDELYAILKRQFSTYSNDDNVKPRVYKAYQH